MWNKRSQLNSRPSDFTRNAPSQRCVSGFLSGLFFTLCLGGGSLFWALPTWAIGVSPASIEVNDLTTQSRIQKELYISRANPKATEYVSITLSGSGATAIQVDQQEQFELPQGVQNTPLLFVIAPEGFPQGTYETLITIQPIKDDTSKGGSSILAGTQAKVTFTVTNEELEEFTLGQIHIQDVGTEELFLSFQATNNNQNKITFGAIQLIIQNQDGEEIEQIQLEASQTQPLLPLSQEEYSLPISVNLPTGNYSGTLIAYDQGQSLLVQEDFAFTWEGKTEPETPKKVSKKILSSWPLLGLIGGASLGIMTLVYLFIQHKNKRKD